MHALSLVLFLAAAHAAPEHEDDAERLKALAKEVSRRVEVIRGLEFRREVAVRVVGDAEAREHFRKRVTLLYPPERMEHDEAVLTQLGLLPAGTSLLDSLLDLLEEQAGGYYDPPSNTFFVLDDTPPDTAPMLMAHELTHALDDQHYDLDGLIAEVGTDDDRSTALSAVVEGSGTAVMSVFTVREIQAGRLAPDVLEQIRQSEAGRAERLRAAPQWLQRSLIAPYTLGLNFVLRGDPRRLLTPDLADDINRAFSEPPSSSEQILHPEKYWGEVRDEPRHLELPDLASHFGARWSLAAAGRLGELSLGVLTGATAPDPASQEATAPLHWTNDAASGLSGDLYQHYVDGSQRATLLMLVWDSERDAEEFLEALSAHPGRRSFQAGERVVLLAGAPDHRAPSLAAKALSGLRLGE
jgi:hypothetical protein